MKRFIIMVMAGIMAMFMAIGFTGCGTNTKKEDDSKSRIITEFTDNGTVDEKGNKWLRHSFYSDNAELAYSQAQKSADYYLTHGYVVSEIVEESTYSGGKCYSFKTRIG